MKCLLEQATIKFPQACAVISPRNTISYRELNLWANSLAPELAKRGTNIAALETNTFESNIILFWALRRAGKAVFLYNTRLPDEIIKKQLKFIRSARLKDFATVLFTSGSSAAPKAIAHTDQNHYYSALGSQINIPLKQNDRWLLSLPLYHVSGLSILYRCCLAGAAVAIPSKDIDIIANIRDLKVTHISLVATQLYRLLKNRKNIAALKKLKAILIGGGPIPPELIKAALRYKLPIYLTYGLTETASQVATSNIHDLKQRKLFAVRPLPFRKIKFANDGEILVRGKVLAPGYITQSGIKKFTNKNGWFATGDIGKKVSADQFLVLGRKDNMFISGGENIYPEEIERVLLSSPAIDQAIIVPEPDKEYGMRPVALIKINATANVARLRKFLLEQLPGYKIPVRFHRIPEGVGQKAVDLKIDRRKITALWRSKPKKFPKL